jgi:hypothetical protein
MKFPLDVFDVGRSRITFAVLNTVSDWLLAFLERNDELHS